MDVDEFLPNRNPKYAHIVKRIPSGWGYWIQCDDGWADLIIQLDKDLAEIDPNYELHQCKEKFGELRYYTGHHEDACTPEGEHDWKTCPFEQRIRKATELSTRTCEVCGQPGQLRTTEGGWYKTVCNKHAGDKFVKVVGSEEQPPNSTVIL